MNYKGVFQIKNYKCISYFCRHNSISGGLLIISRDGLKHKSLKEYSNRSKEKLCEVSAVQRQVDSEEITSSTIYRPPGSDFTEFLDYFVEILEHIKWRFEYR